MTQKGRDWQIAELGDVCRIVPGYAFNSSDWRMTGIPVIKIKNIRRDNTVDVHDVDCVPEEIFTDRLSKFVLNDGDILIAMTGATAGKVGKLRTKSRMLLNQRVAKIEPFGVNKDFIWSIVSSSEYESKFFNLADGAAQPNMSGYQIGSMEIPLPPLPTQRKIAAILSAYDDLIENNTRRIRILEEMAQSIYREWFVNFRFPDHEKVRMVDSKLGEIPEGWTVTRINEFVDIKSGFAFKSSTFTESGYYGLVTIRNVHDGRFISECQSRIDTVPSNLPEHCILYTGDILLSLTGNVGRTCLVYGDNLVLNQRVAKLTPIKVSYRGYIYLLFRQGKMQKELELLANGVAQQNLSPIQTSQMEILFPPENLLLLFAEICEPVIDGILVLYQQNVILRQTRDILLPRLISGELDISDIDIAISENGGK